MDVTAEVTGELVAETLVPHQPAFARVTTWRSRSS
jgi:hypothetical protein